MTHTWLGPNHRRSLWQTSDGEPVFLGNVEQQLITGRRLGRQRAGEGWRVEGHLSPPYLRRPRDRGEDAVRVPPDSDAGV